MDSIDGNTFGVVGILELTGGNQKKYLIAPSGKSSITQRAWEEFRNKLEEDNIAKFSKCFAFQYTKVQKMNLELLFQLPVAKKLDRKSVV